MAEDIFILGKKVEGTEEELEILRRVKDDPLAFLPVGSVGTAGKGLAAGIKGLFSKTGSKAATKTFSEKGAKAIFQKGTGGVSQQLTSSAKVFGSLGTVLKGAAVIGTAVVLAQASLYQNWSGQEIAQMAIWQSWGIRDRVKSDPNYTKEQAIADTELLIRSTEGPARFSAQVLGIATTPLSPFDEYVDVVYGQTFPAFLEELRALPEDKLTSPFDPVETARFEVSRQRELTGIESEQKRIREGSGSFGFKEGVSSEFPEGQRTRADITKDPVYIREVRREKERQIQRLEDEAVKIRAELEGQPKEEVSTPVPPTQAEEEAKASLIGRGQQPTPEEEEAKASLIGRGKKKRRK